MLSKPPVITMLFWPRAMLWDPSITDFIPEEQTLLTVVQGTLVGRPALMEA